MKIKFLLLVSGAILVSLAFMACDTTAPSNNSRVTVNNNTGIVTNSNSTMVNHNDNTTTVTSNTNSKNANITRADYDKDKDSYAKQAKDAGSKIGQGANDLWLWTKTRAALATADDLRDSTISVDVENDVVTLRGTVANATQKTKAETTAKGIDGVKSVKDNLQVKANDSMTNQMVNGNSKSNANTKSNANANKK